MLKRVLVPVKRTVDYSIKVHARSDGRSVNTDVKMSMNPFDEVAMEQAIRLKEKQKVDQVISVSIGASDTSIQDTLRHALSMGADHAIHITLPDGTGNDPLTTEPLLVAKCLMCLIQRNPVELVIMGKQAIDDDFHQTGSMLAGLLGWPEATCLSELHMTDDGNTLDITREIDGGLEKLRLSPPAVLTCDLRLNVPRFLSIKNIMQARKKNIETITLDSLNVPFESRLEVLSFQDTPTRKPGVQVKNITDLTNTVREIVRSI